MAARLLPWIAAALLAAASARADTLVARFDLPPAGQWHAVSLPLAPGAWRVGRVEGPPADAARLRTVLSALQSLQVGGHCASQSDEGTSHPCGFTVADLDLAGRATLRAPVGAVDWPLPIDAAELPAPGAMRPVAVHAPAMFLGDQSKAYGGVLRFRFKAVSNTTKPSRFDSAAGGTVVLHGAPGARVARLDAAVR
jgi:Laminin B (Domain IV)